MQSDLTDLRKQLVEKILQRQDAAFRWGYDDKRARERPDFAYYSPNFRSTLWTLVMLADLKAPPGNLRIARSLRLVTDRFFDPDHGIFRLPGMSHFPIPCLNGNMIYLHAYFGGPRLKAPEETIGFFDAHQRFDDGDFRTPKAYPYCSNTSCYGKHTCYWGVTKLLKGISFIPRSRRTMAARRLVGNCIEFILHHEVCFRSRRRSDLLHPDIGRLTFPNFYKSDFLEILWLLAREKVRDGRTARALELLRKKMTAGGSWKLEKSQNVVVSPGPKERANAFVAERAIEVLGYYGE